MAERKIHTFSVFKSQAIDGGTSGTSAPIDLRDISAQGDFSLSYTVAAAAGATNGTTTFEVLGCPVFDGTYVTAGTFGTALPAGGSGIVSVTLPVMPFVRLKANVGTSSSAKVTAELHVR